MHEKIIAFIDEVNAAYPEKKVWEFFTGGYCWHFAHMLKTTFGEKGDVCLAAPFGHMVYKSEEGRYYDAEGEYIGEALYFIPEEFLSNDYIADFRHLPGEKYNPPDKERCISLMKAYCYATGRPYDSKAEEYPIGKTEKENYGNI